MQIEEAGGKRYIYPKKGYVLTDWDREEILEFTYAKIQIIQPITANYLDYYEITEEECNELEIKQLEKIRNAEQN